MILNISPGEECTTQHVLRLCLHSGGEGKHGGKTTLSTYSKPQETRLKYCELYFDMMLLFFPIYFLSIDASTEDGSFGRLVNDEHRRPNCKIKRIDVNGKPHLCLFAIDDIREEEEITYDYGGEDCPWRTQVC